MSGAARNATSAVSAPGASVPPPRSAHVPLRVQVFWPEPGVAVLKVDGEVDVATAGPLTSALDDLAERRPRVAVVDLTKVDFLGSAGLAALALASEHGDVRVVAPTRQTARPLSITGLDRRMPIYTSRDEALSSC